MYPKLSNPILSRLDCNFRGSYGSTLVNDQQCTIAAKFFALGTCTCLGMLQKANAKSNKITFWGKCSHHVSLGNVGRKECSSHPWNFFLFSRAKWCISSCQFRSTQIRITPHAWMWCSKHLWFKNWLFCSKRTPLLDHEAILGYNWRPLKDTLAWNTS